MTMSSTPQKDDISDKKNDTNDRLALSFPSLIAEPLSVGPLKDESSSYAVVCKICLSITTWANQNGCTDDAVASSVIYQDASYASLVHTLVEALLECLQSHTDRRCRIVAAHCLGRLARAAYARIRVSPLIFSQREPRVLEDEVGTDVPTALVTAALEDTDDGVAAAALQSLAILVLNSSATPIVNDELTQEIQSMIYCKPSPYAPTLRAVVDEDPSIAMAELSARVLDNILAPRLLPLIHRVLHMSQSNHVHQTIPILTDALCRAAMMAPAMLHGVDRTTYAKRWSELDVHGMVQTFMMHILAPLLQNSSAALTHSATLSTLRLSNACPDIPPSLLPMTVRALSELLSLPHQSLESRLWTLAALLIASRDNLNADLLIDLVDTIAHLPATLRKGTGGPRVPTRQSLWTEVAIQLVFQESSHKALEKFLQSPSVAVLWTDTSVSTIPSVRDELTLALTNVAIDTLRHLRISEKVVDSAIYKTRMLLQTLSSCATLGTALAYLEEDFSLLAASQQSYVRLLQEYLQYVGFLDNDTSVTIKLTAHCLPPNLIWDQLSESARYLGHVDGSDTNELDNTTKLLDELVRRELKQGIPSHYMRLYILSLAADHWIQGRVSSIRRLFTSTQSSTSPSAMKFDMDSARQIVLAMNPKRLLAKIFEAHVPPIDSEGRKKRDPIKKLAMETVRVSVASIEGIALMSCDWRRRFGSTQETKLVVSVAIGALQGKVDDTPMNENMRAIMKPLCEVAVARVQAFYESGSGGHNDETFPASELVVQPARAKIKPLVSPSKPPNRQRDEYLRGFLTQLCRQVVQARTELAVQSFAVADSLLTPARQMNRLRLSLPPLPDSRDARLLGLRGEAMAAWGHTVQASSAASDPAAVVIAYTPRRYLRYDGEDEFRLTALMRVCNMTAVEFTEGIRLDIGICHNSMDIRDDQDSMSQDVLNALGGQMEDFTRAPLFVSAAASYRQEIKPGECVTWEIALKKVPPAHNIAFKPSVVFRNIPVEPETTGAKWVGGKDGSNEDNSTLGGDTRASGEDDFQVTKSDSGPGDINDKTTETENVTIPLKTLSISPLACLQPCPFVFFRDACGDIDSFRFLWFRMPNQLPPISLTMLPDEHATTITVNPIAKTVAAISSLQWEGEAIPGGFASKVWAFLNLSGSRVLCVLAEMDNDNNSTVAPISLHIRGEDRMQLFALAGSRRCREELVRALLPKYSPVS